MEYSGPLQKMSTTYNDVDQSVDYHHHFPEGKIIFNELLGKTLTLTFQNKILCTNCGRQTKKSFFNGFCYPCFISAPEAADCIVSPEKCQAHEGIGRDIDWEEKNHLQPHYVYFALSSGVKVGVTRATQVPTRWIDQGAKSALMFAQTPNRYLAGCIEVAYKAHVTDKTSWQKMLKNDVPDIDLIGEAEHLKALCPPEYHEYLLDKVTPTEISYPVLSYPEKVKSVNFDKMDEVSGVLKGIKGQYLIFEDNTVFNVRRHSGYVTRVAF